MAAKKPSMANRCSVELICAGVLRRSWVFPQVVFGFVAGEVKVASAFLGATDICAHQRNGSSYAVAVSTLNVDGTTKGDSDGRGGKILTQQAGNTCLLRLFCRSRWSNGLHVILALLIRLLRLPISLSSATSKNAGGA